MVRHRRFRSFGFRCARAPDRRDGRVSVPRARRSCGAAGEAEAEGAITQKNSAGLHPTWEASEIGDVATAYLKLELAHCGVTYKELAARMTKQGVKETEASVVSQFEFIRAEPIRFPN